MSVCKLLGRTTWIILYLIFHFVLSSFEIIAHSKIVIVIPYELRDSQQTVLAKAHTKRAEHG